MLGDFKLLLICFGTRPEWLKIKPIIEHLNRDEYALLFTGQHEDLLKDVQVDFKIVISKTNLNRLDAIISSCMTQFPNGNFDSVLVQGDTASALGCALAAYNRKIKIFYLEAGLRSGDLENPFPEEAYRQMISRISDINFCPTEESRCNLEKENVSGVSYVTGNSVLDNLIKYKNNCDYENKVLITLHRRENHALINEWFKEINNIAKRNKDFKFIFLMHPNPNVKKHKEILKDIKILDPLDHEELLKILIKCKLVITDSGGLQEESSFFNKKVIVCRKTTERPEALETGHLHICKEPRHLKMLFERLIKNFEINSVCPYGDGRSGLRIKKILTKY